MPKSLVFFTHAPQGTLGDPSSASKLIRSLKAKYGDEVDITISLIVDDKNRDMVKNVFKDLPIRVLLMPQFNLDYQGPDAEGVHQNLHQILKDAGGIIFFPTFHHFTTSDINDVSKYNKASFVVTEYDLHPQNREQQDIKLGDFKSRCIAIDTGLRDESIGIFCTKENDTLNNRHTLPQITGSDSAFRDVLLGSGDTSKYHDTHQLFFGYFNKLNMEAEGHKINPITFIDSCLKNRDDTKNYIDFVLPVSNDMEKDGDRRKDQNGNYLDSNKNMHYIKKYLDNNPLMQGYRYEYWKKDNNGEMQCLDKGGSGEKVLRIINGYPFTPDTMNKLLKGSEDFVMVTGDQSLSEAISNGKIFIYQTMSWKDNFFDALKELVKQTQGASALFQFLDLQDSRVPRYGNDNTIGVFLNNNRAELQRNILELRDFILVRKNLYNNLPDLLMNNIPANTMDDVQATQGAYGEVDYNNPNEQGPEGYRQVVPSENSRPMRQTAQQGSVATNSNEEKSSYQTINNTMKREGYSQTVPSKKPSSMGQSDNNSGYSAVKSNEQKSSDNTSKGYSQAAPSNNSAPTRLFDNKSKSSEVKENASDKKKKPTL